MYAAGVDLNTKKKSYSQSTILHRATRVNNPKITRYLVSHGCDVNCVDFNGKTPLQYCGVDALECAKVLLENHANPNSRDTFGNTIYHNVCDVRGSHEKGSNLNRLGFLRLLHDWNVDPNVCNHDGQTALHLCFKHIVPGVGTLEIIEEMLKHGSDPNAADELERTPIYYLISYLHQLYVKTLDAWNIVFSLLIKSRRYGAKFKKVDLTGMPLLHWLVDSCLSCMEYFDSKLFIELLHSRYDVEVNCQDAHNRTVLHLVSAKGNWTIAEILLNHGACTEIKDCDGNTPLHVAILCRQWVFARKLLLLPLRDNCGINCSVGNKETNVRKENSKGLSKFRQLKRNNSISMFQNEATEHNKTYVTSEEQSSEWTSTQLNAIAKYVETDRIVGLECEEKKGRFSEIVVSPSPTIRSDFINQIKRSSLLELCEKHCVGEFHLVEECKEEHCLIAKQVFRFMSDLVQKCSEIDPKLESKLFWTGSSADGTKMWLPDEFDFSMEIVRLRGSCIFNHHLTDSFQLLLKKECQGLWSKFCLRDDSFILSSSKLKKYISILLWKAGCLMDRNNYKNIHFRLCRYDKNLNTFIKTTKVGVNINVCWRGEKYKNLIISIDLTPAISVALTEKELPNIHEHSVGRLLDTVIHVIPYVGYAEREKWRPSFSLTEVHMIKKLPRNQRALYKGLKLFRDIHESVFAEIPSYHLKTFLLNHLFPDSSDGITFFTHEHESFNCALLYILFRLNLAVKGDIQHFFLKNCVSLSHYDIRWIESTLNILEHWY